MKWRIFKTTIKKIYWCSSLEALQQSILFCFIPGTYQREWRDGAFNTEETIHISFLSGESSLYRVTKKVVETLGLLEDKTVSVKKEESFYATYNKSSKMLVPLNWDVFMAFYPEQRLLIVDNIEYKKIS
jgi:hypothetical protein